MNKARNDELGPRLNLAPASDAKKSGGGAAPSKTKGKVKQKATKSAAKAKTKAQEKTKPKAKAGAKGKSQPSAKSAAKGAKAERLRIYQVAKEFSVSSDALLKIVRDLGIEAKSHMSSIDAETVERVRRTFDEEKEAVKVDFARKREVARAVRRKAAPPEAPPVVVQPVAPAAPPRAPRKTGGRPSAPARRRGAARRPVDQKAVQATIKKTMAGLEGHRRRYRKRARPGAEESAEEAAVLRVTEFLSTSELAGFMEVPASQVIAKAMEMGSMVTINQRLDRDMIEMLADEFGYAVEFQSEFAELEPEEEEEREEDLEPRHPVVTVMGHVDHGKTSLLDYVRQTNVIAGESGGITQHIGAYHVEHEGGRITFLDTPGHEAFTAMRARGAQVTDIVVLVIAADDSVMPQTVEAIDHAKAAHVPIIVAVNKIDKSGADPDRVRQELTAHGITPEEWGGENIVVNVSAKTGEGVDDLLKMILLQAEMLELKANPHRLAKGTVLDAEMDPGRGVVVMALVQEGTLHVGDPICAGAECGRVRALVNEHGGRVEEAGPSTSVAVLGFSSLPRAGDPFMIMGSGRDARETASRRRQLLREQEQRYRRHTTLENFYERIREGEARELKVILKADVEGSLGAVADSLEKISSDEVKMSVLHRGVGSINESDVLLAAASDAIVLAFRAKIEPRARELIARERVDVREYDVIYEAIADVRAAMEGMLRPDIERRVLGTAEVRQVFRVPKLGAIAGSMVLTGVVRRNAGVTVMRAGSAIHKGRVISLKRFKDDVSEVKSGFECGIGVEDFSELMEGDLLEVFEEVEVARRL